MLWLHVKTTVDVACQESRDQTNQKFSEKLAQTLCRAMISKVRYV